jgi:isocitrate dehydrogenase kinase/phosphatase
MSEHSDPLVDAPRAQGTTAPDTMGGTQQGHGTAGAARHADSTPSDSRQAHGTAAPRHADRAPSDWPQADSPSSGPLHDAGIASDPRPADESRGASAAEVIRRRFDAYHREFRAITRRAPARHEQRDWRGVQADALERLDLYEHVVRRTVAETRETLGGLVEHKSIWAVMKRAYSAGIAARPDLELAQTFFNSVTRRIFATVGVDPGIEFVGLDFEGARPADSPSISTAYPRRTTIEALITEILTARRVANQTIHFDAGRIAAHIEARRGAVWGAQAITAIEMLDPVFYRNKGAYLMGRIVGGDQTMPLLIALVSEARRVIVDAVLLTEDEASIVFSFTRSCFHVDVESPRAVIQFLRSLMRVKPVAELYAALGYAKHGKAELYRDLVQHLQRSTDQFHIAPGEAGMVMLVFTLPSYDTVFKVIRDRFAYPKTTTRRHVLERYQLVFKHDRAGRLVDAQEFEHLTFPRDRFSDALVAELRAEASESVTIDGDRVAIKHLYTERRLTPLNLYLRQAAPAAVRDVLIDYGQAIKDLAATNIFPGDLLLKNFGVTRHGRVIFYDYDELCLLTDCNFRRLPQARTDDEEMAAEPWFYVGPHDLFPEEFSRFMGLYADLGDFFFQVHGDLLTTEFWTRMQALHQAGEVVDIFAYPQAHRLGPGDGASRPAPQPISRPEPRPAP